MKNGSRAKFDNTLLKRWLLKVGRERRKILLTKFRADLVRRTGLSNFAWRKGLLQLSSRPFVRLIRDHTATKKKTEKNDRMRGPKSKIKAFNLQRDSNNNNNNNENPNYLKEEELSSMANSLYHKREYIKNEKQDLDRKADRIHYSDRSNSCVSGSVPHRANENLPKVVEVRESETRQSAGSHRSRDSERSNKRKKRRAPKEGENPNGIDWRLVKIDMVNPMKSHGMRFLMLQQAEKKKKKDRLLAKFLEIFGEDIEPIEQPKPRPSPTTKDTKESKETFKARIPEAKTENRNSGKNQLTEETLDRKSPIFSNRHRKRRREDHNSVEKKKRPKIPGTLDTSRDSVTSNNASEEKGRASPVSEIEINSLLDDALMEDWTPVNDTSLETRESILAALEESDTDSHCTICTGSKSAETDKEGNSISRNEDKIEEQSTAEPLGVRLTIKIDRKTSNTVDALERSVESTTSNRQQSVIVEPEKSRDKSSAASSAKSDSTLQSESAINRETVSTQEAETRNSSVPDESQTFPTKDDSADLQSEIPSSPETPISSCNINPKKEPVDQNYPEPQDCPPDAAENDPNPSSTTDTETSPTLGSKMSCESDRLLGALDNIYLALHCRRRVQERVQTASKLAIMRNRQKETLTAQQEFESKLKIFREEIGYLFNRLNTWDRVLRFIAKGLDHRTPLGIKRFSPAEVESAMLDADVKPPLRVESRGSSPVPQLQPVGRVLCTIDLTQERRDDYNTIDICDSSTDPPRSRNRSTVVPKFEVEIDVDDGSFIHDLNANEVQCLSPSIAEVKTISPQQFETFDVRSESAIAKDEFPCYLCSRASYVACALCTRATYCSKGCQEIHWERSHHDTCVPLKKDGLSCDT